MASICFSFKCILIWFDVCFKASLKFITSSLEKPTSSVEDKQTSRLECRNVTIGNAIRLSLLFCGQSYPISVPSAWGRLRSKLLLELHQTLFFPTQYSEKSGPATQYTEKSGLATRDYWYPNWSSAGRSLHDAWSAYPAHKIHSYKHLNILVMLLLTSKVASGLSANVY